MSQFNSGDDARFGDSRFGTAPVGPAPANGATATPAAAGAYDYYAAPGTGTPAFSPAAAAPRPAQPAPVSSGIPTWAKVLIGLGIAGAVLVVLGIVAAIAVPVFLNGRSEALVKEDLTTVAAAQEQYKSVHGTYTGDPAALAVGEPRSSMAILAADPLRYCLAAQATENSPVWYVTNGGVPSKTPCA